MWEYKEYQEVTDWIDTLNPSPNTEKNYLLAIKVFCEWTGKTPGELLFEAEDEIRKGTLMRQRNIKRYLVGFRKMLQEKGYAPMTVKGYLSGIKSFYSINDIELPTLPRTEKVRALEEHKEIPKKEDLQTVLKICDPLEKALLLIGISGGLASNEIINLKISDFKKGYDPKTEIATLSLRRIKVAFDFITFLTPEASRAIWDYLNYREREVIIDCERRQKQRDKQKIYSDNGYLFIGRKIPDTFLETRDERERKLERDALMRIYRVISEKAQKSTPKNNWNIIRSHNMRKYFNSALLNAGCDSFIVEFLMGHTLDDTRSAYFRASPEKLKEIYKKYVPFLTIQKELDISTSPEYLKIKEENQILLAETERHVIERAELTELQQTVQELHSKQEGFKNLVKILAAPHVSRKTLQDLIQDVEKGKKRELRDFFENSE